MTESALEFRGVTRRYGRTLALDGVELTLPRGEILGLVGRNGAGKTTSLKLALGTLWPDAGSIRVLGLDPRKQGLEVRTRVALLAEESALYPWMKVRELLTFCAGIHPRWDVKLAEEFSERLALEPDKKIRELSRGTKAKVALVLAIACRPDLLLLDDPTSGLDPLVRREVLETLIAAMPEEGGTVVYASHLVQDVERLADRVVVLDEGKVTLDGPLDELKARICGATAVFAEEPTAALRVPGQITLRRSERSVHCVAEAEPAALEAALREAGAERIETTRLPLEEILIACLRAPAEESEGV